MGLSADAIWLATAAVDMRTGIDGLSLHRQQALGRPPCDGTAYVFANRRRTRLKLVCWDGTGVWMCLRRLYYDINRGTANKSYCHLAQGEPKNRVEPQPLRARC